MDIFDSVVAVFNFIYSVLDIIIRGISGITSILLNIVNLLFSVIRLLPEDLYLITYTFIGVFSVLFVFKLIKK